MTPHFVYTLDAANPYARLLLNLSAGQGQPLHAGLVPHQPFLLLGHGEACHPLCRWGRQQAHCIGALLLNPGLHYPADTPLPFPSLVIHADSNDGSQRLSASVMQAEQWGSAFARLPALPQAEAALQQWLNQLLTLQRHWPSGDF